MMTSSFQPARLPISGMTSPIPGIANAQGLSKPHSSQAIPRPDFTTFPGTSHSSPHTPNLRFGQLPGLAMFGIVAVSLAAWLGIGKVFFTRGSRNTPPTIQNRDLEGLPPSEDSQEGAINFGVELSVYGGDGVPRASQSSIAPLLPAEPALAKIAPPKHRDPVPS